MCGRFALYSPPSRLARRLGVPLTERDLTARYNVAPGTWIIAVRRPAADEPAVMDAFWWGFKPHWAGESAPAPINATVEKVATSRYFKGAFAHHRCLIPADGWYEWQPQADGKQPYFFCRQDREPLWLAGIWAQRADGSPGCAILTEPARGFTQDIHPRMPVVLDDESLEPWLDPDLTDRETIRHLVHHLSIDMLTHWAVSKRVGPPQNEGEGLVEPV